MSKIQNNPNDMVHILEADAQLFLPGASFKLTHNGYLKLLADRSEYSTHPWLRSLVFDLTLHMYPSLPRDCISVTVRWISLTSVQATAAKISTIESRMGVH